MYKVIKHFVDLQDDNYSYSAGDEFPRRGKIVSEARLYELASSKNKRGTPLIEKVNDGSSKVDVEPESEEKPHGKRSRKK